MGCDEKQVGKIGFAIMKFRLFTASFFGSTGLWILVCTLCWGETSDEQKSATSGKTAEPPKGYVSALICRRCHRERTDEDAPLLCQGNEYATWRDHDVHQNAYIVLDETTADGRAKQMRQLLKEGSDFRQRKECLGCHTGFTDEINKLDKRLEKEGVTCVVCHGKEKKDWVSEHWLNPEWRSLLPNDKENRYGLNNLWNPIVRAELCASCHIGNGADKNMTHEMYAAGHPPLPSFAMEPFCEFMPPHWESKQEKWKRLETEPEIRSRLAYEEKTKSVVIGGMVEFQQTLRSFEEQAKACAQKSADARQIDFAQFDCYACHHDLKKDSWRQKRTYPKMTGRPQLPVWPSPLVTLAIRHAHRDEPLERSNQILREKLERIQKALESQPFGNYEEVVSAAHDLIVWLDEIIRRLNDKSCKYDQAAAEKLLSDLLELNKGKLLDYESARQVFWAFRIIYNDVKPNSQQDPEYKKLIEPFNKLLRPDLRAKPFALDPLINNLASSLKVMSEYEPDDFKKAFLALQKSLPRHATTVEK
jgi:hypothetical protein